MNTAPTPLVGPRERALEEGVAATSDLDLIAIVLGTGLPGQPVTRLANALLERHGGLDILGRLGPAAIAEQPGLGLIKGLRLAAAFEIGRRASARASRGPRAAISTSAEVAAFIRPTLAHLDHEEMWIIALDGRNGVRSTRRVAIGGLHGCAVAPRDVLRAVLVEAASAFVVVHNHPSGDPTPSGEDIDMTTKLARAASLVGVPLLDHVIIARDRYASMLDLGLVE
jgi:DNA repair protein RadC